MSDNLLWTHESATVSTELFEDETRTLRLRLTDGRGHMEVQLESDEAAELFESLGRWLGGAQ